MSQFIELIPAIVFVILYLYHMLFQHLPVKRQRQLKELSTEAVQMVEQVSEKIPSQEKKALAMNTVKALMKRYAGFVPSDGEISTFIESAVYAVSKQGTVPAATNDKGVTS